MSDFGPPEHVFVENEWYDGPRAGIANLHGHPHRFISQFDEAEDDYIGTFLVWPVEEEEFLLEQEQWQIFVAWNDEYEAGRVDTASHPGVPGTSPRWDEIEILLKPYRETIPEYAQRAQAQFHFLEQERRYMQSGPDYQLAWKLL